MSEENGTEVPVERQPKAKPRVYQSEAYVVAIGEAWFLSKDDWTEHPTFAKKYSRAKQADTDAEAERQRHPSKHIRVARIKQRISVSEIVGE